MNTSLNIIVYKRSAYQYMRSNISISNYEFNILKSCLNRTLKSVDMPLAIFTDMAYQYVVLNFVDCSVLITFKEIVIKDEDCNIGSELVGVEVADCSNQSKIETFGNFIFHSICIDKTLKNIEILNNKLSINGDNSACESTITPQCIGLCFEDEKMLIDTKGYDSEIFEVKPYINILDDSYDIGFDWLGDVDDIKNNRFSYERISYSLLDKDVSSTL